MSDALIKRNCLEASISRLIQQCPDKEKDFCDFGIRMKWDAGLLLVFVPGWPWVKSTAIDLLQRVYGENVSFDPRENFAFMIDTAGMKTSRSTPTISKVLSHLRPMTLGAPIFCSLSHVSNYQTTYALAKTEKLSFDTVHAHQKKGTCYCLGTNEKTMVIFVVKCQDPTEQALARIFLKQFELAKKTIAQSPHCEFREKPTAELRSLLATDNTEESVGAVVGYLSFTFFPFHVKTEDQCWNATKQMIDFLPYLDRNLKSTKSNIHSRMRAKKDDLLTESKPECDGLDQQGYYASEKVPCLCTRRIRSSRQRYHSPQSSVLGC